jgi:chromosome segregation ATPase
MTYLLSQIWLCLLITALVAGLLGWLLRGGGKKKLRTLNEKWQDKYDALSQERNSYASKINNLSGITHEKERLENKIETQKKTYDQKLERLNTKLTTADKESQQQQLLLAQKDEELAMSMAQFDKKISEFEGDQQSSNIDLEKKLAVLEKDLSKEKHLNKKLADDIQKEAQSSSQLSQLEADAKNKLKEYQEKNIALENELKSTKESLANTKTKLTDIEKDLDKGKLQVDNLTKGFAIKEKKLNEKLEQKEAILSNTLAEKEKVESNLQQANIAQKKLKEDLLEKKQTLTDKKSVKPDLNQTKAATSYNISIPSAKTNKETLGDKISAAKDSAVETIKAPLDYAKNTPKAEEKQSAVETATEKLAEEKQETHSVTDKLSQKVTEAKDAIKPPTDHVAQQEQHDSKPEEKSLFSEMKEKLDSSGISDKLKSGLDKAKEGIHNAKEEITHKASDAKDSIKSYNHNHESDESSNNGNGIKGMLASAGIAGLAMSGIEKAKDSFSHAKDTLTHNPSAEEAIFPIDAIQSISNEDDRRLYAMGIKTTQDLLTKASTDTGVNLLSKSLGKEEWVVRTWINNADLIRIKGVDGILAELLELAGFSTVAKLATSNADTVSQGISKVHEHITKRSVLPSADEIQGFIDEAKALS